MLTGDFLAQLKRTTETRWSRRFIDPTLYGFQFQRGTRWNPGLLDKEIAEAEHALALVFPHDFRTFLQGMNGTDKPTMNVYGHSGEPQRESIPIRETWKS
jgi:hypothetical protein